jgi:hypothetical protein
VDVEVEELVRIDGLDEEADSEELDVLESDPNVEEDVDSTVLDVWEIDVVVDPRVVEVWVLLEVVAGVLLDDRRDVDEVLTDDETLLVLEEVDELRDELMPLQDPNALWHPPVQ